MDREELTAWLRLLMTPGVGPLSARKLLAAFGSPQAVFDASPVTRRAVLSRDISALSRPPEGLAEQMALTWDWWRGDAAVTAQRHILTLADPRYPAALLEAADPPLVLFAEGELRLLGMPAVAIVGSRHATVQGEENAHAFAQALSQAGVTVVSGLARGIDAAAHEGALAALPPSDRDSGHDRPHASAHTGGSTIAVLGTGLLQVYPKSHTALARRIGRHGLLLSEFLLDTPALRANFPKRNRIVAALARGTLVVEAAVQSGSLITARLAAEMGREVLAIPGSIHAPQARGCHALIKQGAKLVETAQDVLEELRLDAPVVRHPGWIDASRAASEADADAEDTPSAEADPILAALGFDPVSQEALSARTGMGPAEIGVRLLELELLGAVARLPGQLFQRVGRA